LLLKNPGGCLPFQWPPLHVPGAHAHGKGNSDMMGGGAEKGRGTAEGTTEEGYRDTRSAACRGDESRGRARGPRELEVPPVCPVGARGRCPDRPHARGLSHGRGPGPVSGRLCGLGTNSWVPWADCPKTVVMLINFGQVKLFKSVPGLLGWLK